jgi:hypothetical protein
MKPIVNAFIVLIACAVLGGCSEYENLSKQTPSKTTTTPATETKVSSSSSSATPKVHQANESITLADVSYSVKGYEELQDYNGHKTENKFVVVTIEAKNIGKAAATIVDEMFLLIDDQKRQFKTDAMRDVSYKDDNYFSMTKEVNPGLSKTGKVSFEVPNDSKGFILAVRDNMFDFGGAKYEFVQLPAK